MAGRRARLISIFAVSALLALAALSQGCGDPAAADRAEAEDAGEILDTRDADDAADAADAVDAHDAADDRDESDFLAERDLGPTDADAADTADAGGADGAGDALDEVAREAEVEGEGADVAELADAGEPSEAEAQRRPGEGYIGGSCVSVDDCFYPEAVCRVDEAYPDGLCTLACDRLCPDSGDPLDPVTFCIADPDDAGAGICVARCDESLFPGGCREGYGCVSRARFGEPGTLRTVCLPGGGDPDQCTADDVPQPNVGIVQPAGEQGCPGGMTPLQDGGAVCIDRYEAHLVERLPGGGEQPWSPYFNPGDADIRAVSAPGAVPQGYINEVQASRACAAAGKRLCTRAEWELACRGAEQRTYPYGDTRQPGVCNDARAQHPAVEYFGTTDSWIWSELDHPCLNQLDDGLATAGAYPGCVTPEGVFDLMGNLHEWIDDPAGTFKGGYYVDTVINGEGCLYTTTAHSTGHWDYSTGFRCCADL